MKENGNDLSYIKTYLGIIVAVIFVIILKELKSIFIPLFLSIMLYFLFNKVIRYSLRVKIPKAITLFLLLILLFIVFYLFGVLIFSSLASVSDNFPKYSKNITLMLKSIVDRADIPNLDNIFKSINWSNFTPIITGTFGTFATFIGYTIMVIVFLMFMLAGREALVRRLEKAFRKERADKIMDMLNIIEDDVQRYLLVKTAVSAVTAIISLIILFAWNVDFAVFSALLIFILNFIPNFGSIIATSFPVLVATAQKGFTYEVLFIALFLMLTQMIIGNVIEPKITGKTLKISPLIILISLILWGWMWGVLGMILAVPITSALKIIFSHIERLKPIADLIGED